MNYAKNDFNKCQAFINLSCHSLITKEFKMSKPLKSAKSVWKFAN